MENYQEWNLWSWNATDIKFDFNQEGKFYLVCEKDKADSRSYKIIFTDIENKYNPNTTELFGYILIDSFTKDFIKSFIEYGTELGDVFKYDIFYEMSKTIDREAEECENLLKEKYDKHPNDKYKHTYVKKTKDYWEYITVHQGDHHPFSKSVSSQRQGSNYKTQFNPMSVTQYLNELRKQN